MRPVRRARFAVTVTALAAAVWAGLAGAASADLTVKGDQTAWQEIQAAFAKLKALSGYRMRADIQGGSMVVEVTSGGTAMHLMMHSPGGNIESYSVNGQTRMKNDMPGAVPGWHCYGTQSPAMAGPPDPTKVQGTVDVARGQDATIDGQMMHVYLYTVQMGGRSAKQTMYIDAANGLPRRIVVATPQGDESMDYYDYGAPIQFNLPACT
jgi:hypothetical protein